jgi:hypothetical protein
MANKAPKRSKPKNSQLLIRINVEERDQFISLCDQNDTTAARELRRFIKKYIAKKSKP